jgi:two-component system chemotaxis response regulator CheB
VPKIRVLIVDDAVVIRKILSDTLAQDPDIEIVGVAANGKIAIQKIPQCNPDIVTLDVEMPEMNGIETVKKIRETHPKLPIIMFSTLTERGAEITLEALSAGASDYVTKPANVGNVTTAKEMVKTEMLAKIRTLTQRSTPLIPQPKTPRAPQTGSQIVQTPKVPSTKSAAVEMVCLGVSTGGPNALAALLPTLPAEFPVPIVLVQHMPPLFTKMLAQRLDAQCKLRVHEGETGMKVVPGNIYIAPGNFHMELRMADVPLIMLHQGPQENSCRPAVDPLFRSAVALYGAGTLGVILTGMGQDGLHGCKHIRECGGQIIAQDEASSVVWGMPGYVANAGLADVVLPLDKIGAEMVMRVGRRPSHTEAARV